MSEKNKQKKRPYDKPDVKIIELVADEVLAVGCKTNVSGSGGKGQPAIVPFSCVAPSACYSLGS